MSQGVIFKREYHFKDTSISCQLMYISLDFYDFVNRNISGHNKIESEMTSTRNLLWLTVNLILYVQWQYFTVLQVYFAPTSLSTIFITVII